MGVAAPTEWDFLRWHRRWRKKWKSNRAPQFWQGFYAKQFQQTNSPARLRAWGELVGLIKPIFPEAALQTLREVYAQEIRG